MNDPRILALLVSRRRPGFYFRVLQEGEVQARDEIIKLASGPEAMTVAEVDALLYLPGHPRQQLLRALRIPALSPGWQASFKALLEGELESGNAGLVATSPPPAWTGFRRLRVTGIERESDSVISISLEDPDGGPLPPPRPGQYVTLRLQPDKQERSVLRNYSLSGQPGADHYRITVKREQRGAASGYLHTRIAPARTRRSMRRTRPLVVLHRRLPQLRDDAHRRHHRLQPRPGRTPDCGQRAQLLLTAARRRRARSVSGSLPARGPDSAASTHLGRGRGVRFDPRITPVRGARGQRSTTSPRPAHIHRRRISSPTLGLLPCAELAHAPARGACKIA